MRITQQITVPKERQRAIFIGAKGSKLKAIGSAARKDMARYFGKKIHLFIEVSVKK